MNTNMKVATQITVKEAQDGFNRNFVFSPSSIEAMLCMVAVGSKGKTLEQLLTFLGLESADDLNFKPASLEVIGKLTHNQSSGVQLCFLNGVWVDKRFHIVPSYKEVLHNIYKAEANSVDFVNQANEAIEEMNSWSEKATEGLIKEIISRDHWIKLRFSSSQTLYTSKELGQVGMSFRKCGHKKRNFHLNNGKTVKVPFMKKVTPTSFYRRFNGFKVLRIPYERKELDLIRFSMYFILPDKKDGLQVIIEKLNADYGLLKKCFELNEVMLLEVTIPKFKIKCEFEAMDIMKELGLTLPFMPVQELTGIVDPTPNSDGAYITEMIQSCYINVDEKGTKAVAQLRMRGGGSAEGIPTFVADRPFLFMVREDTSGAVFFMGAIINPALAG